MSPMTTSEPTPSMIHGNTLLVVVSEAGRSLPLTIRPLKSVKETVFFSSPSTFPPWLWVTSPGNVAA